MKTKAFTLAEVLLTLAIIGIVAAITIPSILINAEKQSLISAFKSSYSDIMQAGKLIMMDNGGTFIGAFGNTNNALMNTFSNKMIFTRKCLSGQENGVCYHADYNWKDLNGISGWSMTSPYGRANLNNGSMIVFKFSDINCDFTQDGVKVCGGLTVDTNGFRGPNTLGRDIFQFFIKKDNIIASGSEGSTTNFSVYCNPSDMTHHGVSCGARILKENDMNY